MNLIVEGLLILTLFGILFYVTFKIEKPKNLIKKKRYFTKKNELGVYYEEDEKGNLTKFKDGQH